MEDKKIKKMVAAAMFAAFTCVATMIIRIPIPATGGYIHPGDALVILSGVFLGPLYGILAAGIGSALADLIGGYFIYVPITFVIKGLVALLAGAIYKRSGKSIKSRLLSVALGGVGDLLLVVLLYAFAEFFLYGGAAAIGGMGPNAVQGLGGLVLALVLYPVLEKAYHAIS